MNKNKGFTLIELVIVIVILGILAATAAPKFLDITTDAKIATLEGMAGAMKSGSKIVYAKALVQDKVNGDATLDFDGGSISLNSGYPIANWMNGIRYIVNLDDVNFSTENQVCDVEWCGRGDQTSLPSGISTTTGRVGKVIPKGYTFNQACGVYYLNHEDGRAP